MNPDMMINQIAHATGQSRKEVISALRQMSQMPEVKKFLNDQKRRKKTAH